MNRFMKTIQNTTKLESIPYTLLSLNIWSFDTQDWTLEATKAYEVASLVEYIPNPPTLIGKEANLYWSSPKKGHQPTKTSSTAPHNSLSNRITTSSM
jgi:hypothetical protein